MSYLHWISNNITRNHDDNKRWKRWKQHKDKLYCVHLTWQRKRDEVEMGSTKACTFQAPKTLERYRLFHLNITDSDNNIRAVLLNQPHNKSSQNKRFCISPEHAVTIYCLQFNFGLWLMLAYSPKIWLVAKTSLKQTTQCPKWCELTGNVFSLASVFKFIIIIIIANPGLDARTPFSKIKQFHYLHFASVHSAVYKSTVVAVVYEWIVCMLYGEAWLNAETQSWCCKEQSAAGRSVNGQHWIVRKTHLSISQIASQRPGYSK